MLWSTAVCVSSYQPMNGSAMAASAVASAGLTVAVGRSVTVGATMVGTGSGVAVAVGVGVIVGVGSGVAVGAGMDVVRRAGTVGVAGVGAADSRRDPHPQRTSKAMLTPSASNPCRVSHPGVPRTASPGAERLKGQRPA